MASFRPPRGMHDLLPTAFRKMSLIRDVAMRVCGGYGYQMVETPVVEHKSVFVRSLGDDSDVVAKEMYAVSGSDGSASREELILRPEMTASVVRALLSEPDLHHTFPHRWMYCGPMFRYERPQKGRLRQFHQTGIELLGSSHPRADVECLSVGLDFLNNLFPTTSFSNLKFKVLVNSLGDAESRTSYRKELTSHFEKHLSSLSEDSASRFRRGSVLRILDSKSPEDREAITTAPSLMEFLNPLSSARFMEVRSLLQDYLEQFGPEMMQRFELHVDPRLVRGLDYYSHTCFEVACESPLLGESQSTVLAGGRYDGLSEALGGKNVPSIGWAAGVERLSLLRYPDDAHTVSPEMPVVVVVVVGNAPYLYQLARSIRLCCGNVVVLHNFEDVRLDKALKKASRISADFVVFERLCERGATEQGYVIRDLKKSIQEEATTLAAALQIVSSFLDAK
ncbi:mitochondrial histidinyl-tRNA synthetase (HisRS) [Andalucia godoyi]|uniref:histidine--tRNA ligase n=1 Tax=Andalucia godoyi TaxID=505711 RepID=A0A8K0F4B0_ANDGO|nr:mitochondrial histidinyl-tRNA synthetase (HisRS) [Andalucia godoyi]|eukprot:ANDGO_01039.mRNA.1 mitochondrial histidinyl-tRNA synthetase (HisRS)